MKVAFSTSFERSLKKRIKNNPALEKKFWDSLRTFYDNPFHPKIKTHKLTGRLFKHWSFSVEYDVRVIFHFIEKDKIIFDDFGSHEEVY